MSLFLIDRSAFRLCVCVCLSVSQITATHLYWLSKLSWNLECMKLCTKVYQFAGTGVEQCLPFTAVVYGVWYDGARQPRGRRSRLSPASRYSRQLFASVGRSRPQVQDGGRPVSDDPAITLDSFLSGWLILPLPPPPDAGQTRFAATGIFNYNNLRPFGPVKSSARRVRLQEIITCSSCWLGNEWVNRSKDKAWCWRDSADRTEAHL